MEVTTISKGPFKGESFPLERMVINDDDGRPKYQARFADATQVFLEKFPPDKGWQLQVVSSMAPLDMPAYRNAGGQPCPAMFFQASLTSPTGVTIATASTLWVIDGPTAYEKGETNARLRLYQACGLQTAFESVGPASAPPSGGTGSAAPVIKATSEPERSYDRKSDGKTEAPVAAAPAVSDEPAVEVEAKDSIPEDQAETTEGEHEQPVQEAKDNTTGAPANADAPSKSLLKSIETQCRMRGVTMPTLATKAAAMAFLKSLGSN